MPAGCGWLLRGCAADAPPPAPVPAQATKNLERAKKEWDGEPEELAQARAGRSRCKPLPRGRLGAPDWTWRLTACPPPYIPKNDQKQVHNALGYAYFNLDRVDAAVAEYRTAVRPEVGGLEGRAVAVQAAMAAAGPALPLRVQQRSDAIASPSPPAPTPPPQVSLQPGYVTAWNNLGDAYEKLKQVQRVLGSGCWALPAARGAGKLWRRCLAIAIC